MLAELVGKLQEKLDRKKMAAMSAGEEHPSGELRPNLDRLTVGVDLGDQGSHYCILGREGETLAEGQLRTTQEDFATFFQGMTAARVVVEVGTHSPRARSSKPRGRADERQPRWQTDNPAKAADAGTPPENDYLSS